MKITEVPDSGFSILFLLTKYRPLDKMLTWTADLSSLQLFSPLSVSTSFYSSSLLFIVTCFIVTY